MNIKKVITLLLVGLAVGFGGTWGVKAIVDSQQEQELVIPTPPTPDPKPTPDPEPRPDPEPVPPTPPTPGPDPVPVPSPDLVVVRKSQIGEGRYAVTLQGRNIPADTKVTYQLRMTGKGPGYNSANGVFANVQAPPAGGYYNAYVKNANTGQTIASTQVKGFKTDNPNPPSSKPLISAAEFDKLLHNKNYSALTGENNPKVASPLIINVMNMRGGEQKPTDLVGINDKRKFGKWEDFRVTEVYPDETGRIKALTVVAQYPKGGKVTTVSVNEDGQIDGITISDPDSE